MTLGKIAVGVFTVGLFTATLLNSRSAAQNPPDGSGVAGFPDLVGGLKATEGCLGVETARASSGKNLIFAWFEDKKAALRWYRSDMHKGVMKQFFPDGVFGTPMKGVPDDSGPIMAIASITMADAAQLKQSNQPISQIAIELYQPLRGGIYLGGRFAPDGVKVSGLQSVGPVTPGR